MMRRVNSDGSAAATVKSHYRKVKETAAELVRKADAARTRAQYTKQATAEAIAKYTLTTLGRGSIDADRNAGECLVCHHTLTYQCSLT